MLPLSVLTVASKSLQRFPTKNESFLVATLLGRGASTLKIKKKYTWNAKCRPIFKVLEVKLPQKIGHLALPSIVHIANISSSSRDGFGYEWNS